MEERIREALIRFFSGFLEVLGEEGEVEVHEEAGGVYVNLRGRFKSLPQDDGEFRVALARLATLHVKTNLRQALDIEVDVNGQEEARRKKLLTRVLALAERARAENHSFELEPMPPKDRRLIHLTLASFPGVRTYSVGKGADRRVVIAPAEEKLARPESLPKPSNPPQDGACDAERGKSPHNHTTQHRHHELPQGHATSDEQN